MMLFPGISLNYFFSFLLPVCPNMGNLQCQSQNHHFCRRFSKIVPMKLDQRKSNHGTSVSEELPLRLSGINQVNQSVQVFTFNIEQIQEVELKAFISGGTLTRQ